MKYVRTGEMLSPVWFSLGLWVALAGCQPQCQERCVDTQERCAGSIAEGYCEDQCQNQECADCYRCIDEEELCEAEAPCDARCTGCVRTTR